MEKIIFHIDINAFFSSVEEIYHPELKLKPIAICGFNKKAVISTCNYLARQKGVRSAMHADKAKELCREIIFIKPNYDLYKKTSDAFFALLREYTKEIEIISIDECFMDVTELVFLSHNNPKILALQIQDNIFKKLNLPVSIGISDSKFFAKVASDLKKPLGIETLFRNEINEKFLPLEIDKFIGIGVAKIEILKNLNINTMNDLLNYQNQSKIQKIFGSYYQKIINTIKGNIEDNLVKTNKEFTKSISKSNTFCNLENDLERIDKEIIKIVEEIQETIAQNKIEARTITITIKAFNFKKISKSQTFKTPINQNNLLAIARNLFLDIFDNQEINYLSIGLSKLQWV